jgi:hypothetical protein
VYLQAVALQLASDVIKLRSQLEDAQVELGVEKLARQVQQQQQLTGGPGAATATEPQQHQQDGDAAACRNIEEWLQQCQASVLQTLQERRGENEVGWLRHKLGAICNCCCAGLCVLWTSGCPLNRFHHYRPLRS